jgi:hypothetical protein
MFGGSYVHFLRAKQQNGGNVNPKVIETWQTQLWDANRDCTDHHKCLVQLQCFQSFERIHVYACECALRYMRMSERYFAPNIFLLCQCKDVSCVRIIYSLTLHVLHHTQVLCASTCPSPRSRHAMAAVSRRVYLYGGVQGNGADETILDDLWVLDAPLEEQPAWERLDIESVGPRAGHSLLGGGNILMLLGGVSSAAQIDAMMYGYALALGDTPSWNRLSSTADVLYSKQVRWMSGTRHACMHHYMTVFSMCMSMHVYTQTMHGHASIHAACA